jgi:hypothetical protein
MTQHTPGPWQFKIDSSGEVPTDREIVICFYDRRWDDLPYHGAYAICTVHDTGEDGDGGLANACLIAAAPELLEALRALMPAGWDADDTMDHMPGIRLARAAIAKAEGGGG